MAVRSLMNKSLIVNEEEFLKQFDGPTSFNDLSSHIVGRIKILDKLYQYDYISKDKDINIVKFMFKNIDDVKSYEYNENELNRFVKLYNNLCNGIIDQDDFYEAMINKDFDSQNKDEK